MKEAIETYVGKIVYTSHGDIKFEVRIKDVEREGSAFLFLVSPIAGSGTMWIKEIEKIET